MRQFSSDAYLLPGRRSCRICDSRVGVDGQAESTCACKATAHPAAAALEVLGDQRVVGGLDAMLHGQVQAGGRLAAAADAQQDHVGAIQVARALAVVVRQAEVDGLDAVVVFLALADVGKAAHAVVALDAELQFQRLDEGAEHVQHQRPCSRRPSGWRAPRRRPG
jgi:hypothetical protein